MAQEVVWFLLPQQHPPFFRNGDPFFALILLNHSSAHVLHCSCNITVLHFCPSIQKAARWSKKVLHSCTSILRKWSSSPPTPRPPGKKVLHSCFRGSESAPLLTRILRQCSTPAQISLPYCTAVRTTVLYCSYCSVVL